MYCKKCGSSNNDNHNYCKVDGEKLTNNYKNVSAKKAITQYCNDCGNKMMEQDVYCKNCGKSTMEVTKVQSVDIKKTISSMKINYESILKYAGISSAIILVINFILSIVSKGFVNRFINDEIGFELVDEKFLSTIDITLLSNAINTKLSIITESLFSAELNYNIFIFLLVLIPAVVFFIVGIVKSKNDIEFNRDINIKEIMLIGLAYGIILSIIAIIGNITPSIDIYLYEKITVSKKYGFIQSIINGTMISSVSILLGYLTYSKFKHRDDIVSKHYRLFTGLKHFGINIIIVNIVVMLFALIENGKNTISIQEFGLLLAMCILISPIAFIILNYGTVAINEISGTYNVKLSLFNQETIKNFIGYGSQLKVWHLYIVVIIFLAIFFYSGGKIKKRYGHNIKNILYSCLAYSVLLAMFAYMLKIEITGNGHFPILEDFDSGVIRLKVSVIGVFITSYIFSFLGMISGYFITNYKS